MKYNYYNQNLWPAQNERFLIPFLLGGLGGAAVTSVSRPRPVFVTGAMQPMPYYPYGGYGYSNYNYFY